MCTKHPCGILLRVSQRLPSKIPPARGGNGNCQVPKPAGPKLFPPKSISGSIRSLDWLLYCCVNAFLSSVLQRWEKTVFENSKKKPNWSWELIWNIPHWQISPYPPVCNEFCQGPWAGRCCQSSAAWVCLEVSQHPSSSWWHGMLLPKDHGWGQNWMFPFTLLLTWSLLIKHWEKWGM